MSRRKDVFNSPEYRHIEENLDDILKELEGDEETRNMTMPEEWDKDFREILEKVNEENRQRHRKKLRRTIAAAAAVLIVSVPLIGFVGTETVEGDGILELIENVVNFNGRQYDTLGTSENYAINEIESDEIIFTATKLEELNSQIDAKLSTPFFEIEWVPERFSICEAVYNKKFDVLNVEFSDGKTNIFFSQQTTLEEGAKSNVTEDDKVDVVQNENLDQNIYIYRNIVEEGLSFAINTGNSRLNCYANIPLNECKQIAESIKYE